MKTLTTILLLLAATCPLFAQEDTPRELVNKLIQTEHNFAYNPTNDTPDELLKADAINAELSLKQILLSSELLSRVVYGGS